MCELAHRTRLRLESRRGAMYALDPVMDATERLDPRELRPRLPVGSPDPDGVDGLDGHRLFPADFGRSTNLF